ncbi:response regulator [Lachnospiraceae bacterium AM23-2LB]|nr:response regulator [Lachnospiraceae bacterium AM23-2LB]RJW05124.1 response regulator [Lachnospiraceae bacterium AM40-2BH]
MKILIIDDEPKIRNGLSNLLTRREGWEVAGAYENAADALKYLAVNQVDVMITDIKMPEISGLELIARIRERDKKTAIIILSGYSNFQFAQRAIELGVSRYLTKPTNPRELICVLEETEKKLGGKQEKEEDSGKIPNLFVQKAADYIKLNYSEKISIKEIADQLYLSPNYLSELFKKHTGKTISEYLTEYRLEKACQLLDHAEYRVGDVSGMVGIHDGRYFSNMFKKKYGMTPTEYRNH